MEYEDNSDWLSNAPTVYVQKMKKSLADQWNLLKMLCHDGDWHMVHVTVDWDTARNWLKINCSNRFESITFDDQVITMFKSKEEAALFKTMFG